MEVKHVESLKKVTLHEAAQSRRMLIGATIAVMYAVSGHFVYTTIGEPRRLALAHKEEVHLEEWWDDPWADLDEVSVPKKKKNAPATVDPEIPEEVLVPDVEESLNATTTTNSTASAPKKGKRIPSKYQPNAWAGAALFLVISGHILFHLMCYWRPTFKASMLYQPARKLK
eukprot:515629-Amorphochlora_amoeboformis.AAC.2